MLELPAYLRLLEAMPRGPRFMGWFGASKVTLTGDPMIVYWGGYATATVGAMTRFGTARAAAERLLLDTDTPESTGEDALLHEPAERRAGLAFERRAVWGTGTGYHHYREGAVVVPCFLRIVRPLVLTEDPRLTDDCEHAAILRAVGYGQRDIRDLGRNPEHGGHLANLLLAKGYDGVTYPDVVEGDGEAGWIILDASQAWPVYGDRFTSAV